MSSLIGQSLGRYQILEQLGEGGMATVYKAYDTRLERFVAIKIIRTEQFGADMLDKMLKRFEREAKALAQLSHPNIVHMHDYGEYEGAPYLVMEYLPSGTLKQRSGTPLPWQQALQLLLPIAQALAYAHEHNIIHRDIKPANILLTENGLPMLSDFGIAKILESNEGATLTGAGISIGTPEYMAPEQWKGQSGPRSDIYSLGVVLYELVTGRKPYTADTPMAIMVKQIKDSLPRPSQIVPDLPEGLEKVLLKALARQPEDRFQSMDGFAAALQALAGGQTLPAGVNAAGAETDKTLLATGETGRGAVQPTMLAGGVSTPAVRPIPEIPFPPEEQRKTSRKWGRWILIAVLVFLLCSGVAVGAGLLIRGLNGTIPPAGQPTSTATPTLAAAPTLEIPSTQVIPPTMTSLPALLPTSTPTNTLTPPPEEVKVLWDISHGPRTSTDGSLYTPDGMYKSLAQYLANKKLVITSGDLTNLNSYDILVLSATSADKTPYTSNEADQIEQFVRMAGHGLLILSDIPGFENLADSVGRRFSIVFGNVTSDGPVSYSEEPFFSGAKSIQFLFGGGIFQVSPPSQTAAVDKSGNSVIAFCECDAGRVMAIADANLWDNRGLSQADNQRFAEDVFLWLARLTP
jgi:tRNA A-37 threonylcarbamoyl transferase component Bud32